MKIFNKNIVKILAQENVLFTTKAMSLSSTEKTAKTVFGNVGVNTLVSTTGDPKKIAGGPDKPFCSEAWDAISRYIYTGLQGGSIMKGWMKEENTMIACCSDGTRPVIFKIERIDIPE